MTISRIDEADAQLETELRLTVRSIEDTPDPVGYLRVLSQSADEYISAGGWSQLLAARQVPESEWDEVIRHCRHRLVRKAAIDFFEFAFEQDWAIRAAETPAAEPVDIERELARSRLFHKQAERVAAEGMRYLETGKLDSLIITARTAEREFGWRAALKWLIRALALFPRSPDVAVAISMLLLQSGQSTLAVDLAPRLARTSKVGSLVPLCEGVAAVQSGDGNAGRQSLEKIRFTDIPNSPQRAMVESYVASQLADTLELTGDYRECLEAYEKLNTRARSRQIAPGAHYNNVLRRKALPVPSLPRDARNDVFCMLGFPRSGTTLLENALNAHPLIETFEEIPSHKAAIVYIYRKLGETGQREPDYTLAAYEEARRRYYLQLDIRRNKPSAHALVDKMPIQSGEAQFMSRLFPERRYIFAIRHPFDVVLSCFKQQFAPNAAMENFRTISDSVKLYDFTMSEWFSVFDMQSPEVCYVRYEELVPNFAKTVARVTSFVGVPWNDQVLSFARTAENRGYRTPSYEKVRKGLSIGVQTSWRHYDFLFQSPETRPLHEWANFFGYPTQ